MTLRIFIRFEQCLMLNFYLDLVWMFCEAFSLYFKVHKLERRTKFLAMAVYCLIAIVESVRLVLGNFGVVYKKIPELAGFIIVSVLMHFPIVSFFLFHQHLLNNPVETTLHAILWILTTTEIVISIFAIRKASRMAKYMFFRQSEQKQITKII